MSGWQVAIVAIGGGTFGGGLFGCLLSSVANHFGGPTDG